MRSDQKSQSVDMTSDLTNFGRYSITFDERREWGWDCQRVVVA